LQALIKALFDEKILIHKQITQQMMDQCCKYVKKKKDENVIGTIQMIIQFIKGKQVSP
jgi:hypothetical protein